MSTIALSFHHSTIILLLLSLVTVSLEQSLFDGLIKLIQEGENQVTQEPLDMSVKNILPEYDFIVVGAGTAGCVVANRLSENPDWTVLLVEAGRPENYLMDMPILANYLQFTESNWKYSTEPSGKACMGFDGQRCNWPRGKVVGGSSVLNYMIYTRGNHRDYDNWAKLGNTGWSFNDVLPYFKKIEKFSVPVEHNKSYHGTDGYLSVDYAPYQTKIAEAIVNASLENGIRYADYNGPTQPTDIAEVHRIIHGIQTNACGVDGTNVRGVDGTNAKMVKLCSPITHIINCCMEAGVSRLQLSMRDGVRESSSRAYLHPVSNRPNLHMTKYSMIKKIIIDPITKRVKGVEMVKGGVMYNIGVRKEVISSAGAINSPQLLMLSGIGPKKHLTQHEIPVISNLKVGYNLMDHIATGGITFLINKPYSLRTDKIITNENLKLYFNHHKGSLSVPGGCEVLVFQELDNPQDPDGYPDIELLYQGGSIVSDIVLRKDFGITDEIYDAVYTPIKDAETFMVFPMLLRPKSKGRILLKNNNYRSKPLIFPNYFAHPDDMKTIIKGVRLILNITSQPSLQALGAKLHNIPIPQCAQHQFASDAYFDCMTRHFTFTIYHQSGTCKMGPPTDKKAVVDPRLRVYGVKGLRVIDASVMPEIPAAHTNAPTFMIAEKGSDMIKQDWGFPTENIKK